MARHTSIGDAYRNRKERRARPNFILAQNHQIRETLEGVAPSARRALAGETAGLRRANLVLKSDRRMGQNRDISAGIDRSDFNGVRPI